MADPLLSSFRKRITGTFGVLGVKGLDEKQSLEGLAEVVADLIVARMNVETVDNQPCFP